MQNRYFEEPYQFIPPYRNQMWCRVFQHILPHRLRGSLGIHRWEFRGTERLRDSLARGAGVLLAPNHTQASDPPVLGLLGSQLGHHFYYAASWHLFKKSRVDRWLLNRLGAFSIFREGVDRDAIRECSRILINAERPLVLFPEGTYFWQNDRLAPLQDGVGLIARAAQREAKRPIVIHPVAIKYWYLEDPRPALCERLASIEKRLQWQPQKSLSFPDRIAKLSGALLSIKEMEYLGEPQEGEISYRAKKMLDHLLGELEVRFFGEEKRGRFIARFRALRGFLVPRLAKMGQDSELRTAVWDGLAKLWFCQQLIGHDQEYLDQRPSLERLAESVLRIEEDVTDNTGVVAPMGVVVDIGDPLHVEDYPAKRRVRAEGCDPLMVALAQEIQGMLDTALKDGPPASWGCPARIESDRVAVETASALDGISREALGSASERTTATMIAKDQT